MKILKRGVLFCAVVMVSAVSTPLSAQNGTLQLIAGSKYQTVENTSTHTIMTMSGRPMDTDMQVSSTYDIQVNGLVGDQYDMTATITRMKLHLNRMGQDSQYDSDNPESDSPLKGPLMEVVNNPQKVRVSKGGNVVVDKNLTNNSDLLSQARRSGFGVESTFLSIPLNLQMGKSFEVSKKDEVSGSNTTIRYTLASKDGDEAIFTFTGTLNTDGVVQNQGTNIDTKTHGTLSGQTVVYWKTGVVKSSDVKSDSNGTIKVMGQEIPISIKTESKVTVTTL